MKEKELDQLRDHYEWSLQQSKEWGLNPFPVDFHVVPAERMYEIASYGFPGHFSHWTYGRDYWRQKTNYDHGQSKIYELVVNSNPAQAFLMETNSVFENQFTISHVIGHSHFFANNAYYDHTGRRFDQSVAVYADRIREFELEHGRYTVEALIDNIFTIDHHINSHLRVKKVDKDYIFAEEDDPFEDLFPEVGEEQDARELAWRNTLRHRNFPIEPVSDLMGWIARYGDLQDWEREVIWMMREEALYFLPMRQTKIINEGFASLIHRCLMHEADLEDDIGGISFAQLHSRVFNTASGALNPYVLGYNILWDVIQEYGGHTDQEMDNFEFINGSGWEKVLEIAEIDCDVTLVSSYLSERVCEKMDLFEYGFQPKEEHWIITEKDWEKVRNSLVESLADSHVPEIVVIQGASNKPLQLKNMSGKALDPLYTKNTITAITALWGHEVRLESHEDGHAIEYSQDGDKIVKKRI